MFLEQTINLGEKKLMKMIFKKNNKLKLEYESEHLWVPPIIPTKNVLPDWYKKIVPLNTSNLKSLPQTLNVKSCVPFMDTFLSGYVMTTPMDIAVKINDEGNPVITWSFSEFNFIGVRGLDAAPGLPIPQGYNITHFTWSTMSAIKIPKGYSCLVTHPLNRYDLPFLTLSGIVDADDIFHHGNIPFFIKEGFEGLIKAGTPMFQIIPFKREEWESVKKPGLFKIASSQSMRSALNTVGWYKKNNWKRKIYN